ncbi:MAG TPA: response regulator [Candidatus Acidoferrales bacterium]|jgi:DNA-binding response OmpR family regulator|nr:response regulator [Candidatus Acidoferrales bacterium]
MKSALLVDSEPAVSEVLQEILKSEGMEAVTLASASDAADYAQARKFDVVFVDSSSPVSDGIELTRKIRGTSRNHRTPIVMITTPKYTGFLTEGFQAGVSFMVYKPIDRTRLVRLVRVMQGAIENEIRRFRRVATEVRMLIRNGDDELEGATINLSLNGALIRAPRVFPRGTLLKTHVFLAPADPVIGHAVVMRTVSNDRMGIQFDGLALSESMRLQDYLLRLLPL